MGYGFATVSSEHARRRSQQRGIGSEVVDLILSNFDTVLHAGDGCQTVQLSREWLAELHGSGVDKQTIDRAAKVVVVMREDNWKVVTVILRYRSPARHPSLNLDWPHFERRAQRYYS